jgi:hypothetical protein
MPPARKSVSPKQLAANRANAAKSTGPRTPEGKARSAQNGFQHGFAGSTSAAIRLEDLQEIAHLRADLLALYRPVNAHELFAIDRIAHTQQAILRASRLESGLFLTCLAEELTGDLDITRAQNRNYLLGEGFHRFIKHCNSWSVALRYQAQAEHRYRRAIEEFERLRALRQEFPAEPISGSQPEPIETTCTP